jgi:hypothetical protein
MQKGLVYANRRSLRQAVLIVISALTWASVAHGHGGAASKVGAQRRLTPLSAQASPLVKTRSAVAAKLKVGPPKSGPKVANPFAAQKSAAIIMQLDQQRRAADKEASEMKLGLRPAQTGTLLHPPAPNTSGTGTKGVQTTAPLRMPPLQGPSSTAPRTNAGAAARSNAPSTLLKPTGPGTLGPGSTDATRTSRSMLAAPSPTNTLALTCAHDPTMRILNVSGKYFPATFTTIKKYDFYTITGCSLGNPGPNAKVYIYKGNSFREEFQIQEWHENWINLDLDPNLTGLLDQDNLTLVVQRADGHQASKGGYKFYADREQVLLRSFPRRSFSLWGLSTAKTSAWKVTYQSPGSATDGLGFQGMTAEVQWNEQISFMKSNLDTTNAPAAGRDVYDFKFLQPGFIPTQAYLRMQDGDCSYASGKLITSGHFNLEWQNDQLWVDWQGQNCSDMKCGNAFQGDCFAIPNTDYAIDVWVEGPRGVDPQTGLPTRH